MKAVLLLVLCIACTLAKPTLRSPPVWKDCGHAGDHIKVDTLDVTPNPPKIGQNVTFTATGTSDEQITSGTLDVTVLYGQIALVNQTFDLCSAIASFGINCPIAKGPLKFVVNQYIPPILFPGAYEAIIKPHDQNGQEAFCVDVQFNLVSAEAKAPKLFYRP